MWIAGKITALATATALLGMALGRLVARLVEKQSRFYPSWLYFWVEVTGAVLLFIVAAR